MKQLFLFSLFVFTVSHAVEAQDFSRGGRESMQFPKEAALLNIRDSILIGKYFVAVKGYFFSNALVDEPAPAELYIKGYRKAKQIRLQDLKENFELLSTDTSLPVSFGDVALLKTNNAAASTSFMLNVHGVKKLLKADLLEPGDIIAFVGMRGRKGNKTYTFQSRWYTIVK